MSLKTRLGRRPALLYDVTRFYIAYIANVPLSRFSRTQYSVSCRRRSLRLITVHDYSIKFILQWWSPSGMSGMIMRCECEQLTILVVALSGFQMHWVYCLWSGRDRRIEGCGPASGQGRVIKFVRYFSQSHIRNVAFEFCLILLTY